VLDRHDQDLFKRFVALERELPRAARAEAVTFCLFEHLVDHIEIHEDESTGGPDFICSKNDQDFLVEATSLSPESSADRSGIGNEELLEGGVFSLVTEQLVGKAKSKARQMANQPVPRLLMMVSEHVANSALFGSMAVDSLLLGDYSDGRMRAGAFVRFQDGIGAGIPIRQSISGILLVGVYHDEVEVRGLLHPRPAQPFDPNLLRAVPFAEVENPVRFPGNPGRVRWLNSGPIGFRRKYSELEPHPSGGA
jgi:hypothetical protein